MITFWATGSASHFLVPVKKGDKKGHPFRGNQYVKVGGGSKQLVASNAGRMVRSEDLEAQNALDEIYGGSVYIDYDVTTYAVHLTDALSAASITERGVKIDRGSGILGTGFYLTPPEGPLGQAYAMQSSRGSGTPTQVLFKVEMKKVLVLDGEDSWRKHDEFKAMGVEERNRPRLVVSSEHWRATETVVRVQEFGSPDRISMGEVHVRGRGLGFDGIVYKPNEDRRPTSWDTQIAVWNPNAVTNLGARRIERGPQALIDANDWQSAMAHLMKSKYGRVLLVTPEQYERYADLERKVMLRRGVQKGDYPGHPFRGNQYVKIGGGTVITSETRVGEKYPPGRSPREVAMREHEELLRSPDYRVEEFQLAARFDDIRRDAQPDYPETVEASARIQRTLGPDAYVDIKGMQPEHAQELAGSIERFSVRHPDAASHLRVVRLDMNRELGPNTEAATSLHVGTGGTMVELTLSRNYALKPPAYHRSIDRLNERSGWHPVNSARGTFDHELGHVVDYTAARRAGLLDSLIRGANPDPRTPDNFHIKTYLLSDQQRRGMFEYDLRVGVDRTLLTSGRKPSAAGNGWQYAAVAMRDGKGFTEYFAEAYAKRSSGGRVPAAIGKMLDEADKKQATQLPLFKAITRKPRIVSGLDGIHATQSGQGFKVPLCSGYTNAMPEVMAISRKTRTRKGDKPGHPFRGNQYVRVGGRTVITSESVSDDRASQEHTHVGDAEDLRRFATGNSPDVPIDALARVSGVSASYGIFSDGILVDRDGANGPGVYLAVGEFGKAYWSGRYRHRQPPEAAHFDVSVRDVKDVLVINTSSDFLFQPTMWQKKYDAVWVVETGAFIVADPGKVMVNRTPKRVSYSEENRKGTILTEGLRPIEPVSKGDKPGHPFRGNQYVKVGGFQPKIVTGQFTLDEGVANKELLAAIFEQVQPPDGTEFDVGEIRYVAQNPNLGKNSPVTVMMSLYDSNTIPPPQVGMITWRLYPQAQKAELELMVLDGRFQGSGFAAKHMMAVEANLKANGIKKVELTANLDVGGFAWARLGYEFQNRFDYAGNGREYLQMQGYKPPYVVGGPPSRHPLQGRGDQLLWDALSDPKGLTAREFSELGRGQYSWTDKAGRPMWPGKWFMLQGPTWKAEKIL